MEARRRRNQAFRISTFLRKWLKALCLFSLVLYAISGLEFSLSEKSIPVQGHPGKYGGREHSTRIQFQLCIKFAPKKHMCVHVGGLYRDLNLHEYHLNWRDQWKSIMDILPLYTVLGFGYLLMTRLIVYILDDVIATINSFKWEKIFWLLVIVLTKAADFYLIFIIIAVITYLEYFCRKLLFPGMSIIEDSWILPILLLYVVGKTLRKLAKILDLRLRGTR